jgi:hypothetical protein
MADINGTENGDTLSGTDAADVIRGLGGNDFIESRGGDDNVDGGDGDDVIYFGTGTDELRGGAGNDSFYAANSVADAGLITAGDRYDGGIGIDSVTIDFRLESSPLILDFSNMAGELSGTANGALFFRFEQLWVEGSSGNDNVTIGSGSVTAGRLYAAVSMATMSSEDAAMMSSLVIRAMTGCTAIPTLPCSLAATTRFQVATAMILSVIITAMTSYLAATATTRLPRD